jgi:MFS family permease
MPIQSNTAVHAEKLSPEVKRSIIGGIVSMFLDTWDVYLPALILPAAMGYFMPKSMPAAMMVTLTTMIFAVSLLARPLGSAIFGNLADKIGRKKVAMTAASGFTIMTLLMAIIPGYEQWGYMSVGSLIFLRLIAGIFLGGGYAAPIPLALERSPQHLRGLVSGTIAAAAPACFVVMSGVQLVILTLISREEYTAWGWRIPFFIGVLLGIAYLIYYSRIPELSKQHLSRGKTAQKQPIFELFKDPASRKTLGQVFLMTSGYWVAAQMGVSFMPGLYVGYLHLSPTWFSSYEVISSFTTMFAIITLAYLSQKYGRRTMMMFCGFGMAVIMSLAFFGGVELIKANGGYFEILVAVIVLKAMCSGPLGVMICYLNERFPTRMRSSGYSVAYSFGLIIPGFYSVYLLWLSRFIPYEHTALIFMVVGGVFTLFAAWLGPETKDVNLLEIAQKVSAADLVEKVSAAEAPNVN